MSQPLYRDPTARVEDRADDLLAAMTIEEKLAQLGCLWSTSLLRDGVFDPDLAAGLMPHGIGQVTRIGAATGLHPRESAALMNAIQRVAIERTRLGIPIVLHEESVGGFCHRDATVFPQGLGLAATWDPDLLERVAGVIREQMRAVGARMALAPVMDVARDPRWGRVEETYGEDPILTGILATAYVRGLQTADLRDGVVATAKHFLAYAHSDGGRNCGPVHLGQRELLDVYAEPFAATIRDAGLAAVMNSYASLDGAPCGSNPAILTDLLRDQLGFDGVVVSDYSTIDMLEHYHRVAADRGEAARIALLAGLDMELPEWRYYREPLMAEVEAGRVPLAIVDRSVRRVLRMKLRLGLFEQPYVDEEAASAQFQTAGQRRLARQAVAESVILLSNDGVLPLSPSIKHIAMVGPGVDDRRLLQGDYHYPTHLELVYESTSESSDANMTPRASGPAAPGPYYTPHVTPLAGLRAALGGDVQIDYAKGCSVLGSDRTGFGEAVAKVRGADLAVVVLAGRSGLQRPVTVGEFNDATSLDLTGVQEDLFEAIAATGTPLIVVVMSGRVHTLSRISERANALLMLVPPGEEGGNGLADVLTGAVNPSGRLPVSLLRSVGQIPTHMGYRAGGNRPMFLGDYVDSPTTPLFAFGHGLSYTTFSYDDLEVEGSSTEESVTIAVTVRNTGDRGGTEVVQLYGRDDVATVARPDQMLLGFSRLAIGPGEARRVSFAVHPSRLAFWNADMRFVVEPGTFTFSVGPASDDIRDARTIRLTGTTVEYRQREIVATRAVSAAGLARRGEGMPSGRPA